MQKHFTLIILLSVALFLSCHKKEISTTTNKASSKSTLVNNNNTPIIKDAIVDPSADLTNTGAAYTIDSLKINGDILSLFINYSGGCNEHTFELFSNGMYAKSLPPQLSVCLRHTNNGEACRELINQELKFNVTKFRYPGKNTVVLKLGDKQRITYTFKQI